ncbi:DUF998 domain-containing protein [Rhodococcus koreensis]|uniref:DUF998 domain-containing protein n=1 Tax=Rhodococcus koreensis TaxID=99653 RepID=UPI001980F5A3|nr:DUF998 domain-containing protein [Rhodococcus koreensis]QSE84745.1 DUF998 domain-containing protein [Rhodococcus koreensis]
MTTYDYRRVAGGIVWTLAIGYLLSETLTAEAWRTPYSFVYNSISDLGVTNCSQVCSPLHSFMNLSFVAMGLLMTVGAILLRGHLPSGRLHGWTMTLAVVTGLSTAATGLFPTNYGPMIHLAAVLPAFVARHVVLGLVAWGLWDRRRWTAIWSTVCALAGLAGGVLLAVPSVHFGVTERIILYPLPIWMVVTGAMVLLSVVRAAAFSGRTSVGPTPCVKPRVLYSSAPQ